MREEINELHERINMAQSREVSDALLKQELNFIKNRLAAIELKLDQKYVTRVEFDPIQRLVYGMVGLILISVVGALISLVVLS